MAVQDIKAAGGASGNLLLLLGIGALTAAFLPLADIGRGMGLAPTGYAFLQLAGAGTILLGLVGVFRVHRPVDARHLSYYLVSGATGLAGPNLVLFALLEPLGPSTVALFYVLPPVMTYALAVALGRRILHNSAGRSHFKIASTQAQLLVVQTWRTSDPGPFRSATCPRESVLPIRPRSDFTLFSKGFAGQAEHRLVGNWPKIRSLGRIFSGPDDCAALVNSL